MLLIKSHKKRGQKIGKENEHPRVYLNMLIMCEVVSTECETLPPPPSGFLSPKEKRKGVGRALAIQSKADLFNRCRLFTVHGHVIS